LIENGEVVIAEDKYHPFAIELLKESKVTVEFSRTSGPEIDIFTVNEAHYNKWKEKQEKDLSVFEPITALSRTGDLRGTLTTTLQPGKYYVIFDNTNYGKCKPPTNTKDDKVSLTLTVKYLERKK
jgi:hypothetical protein